jgi:tyrosyl-tRNA synthetase
VFRDHAPPREIPEFALPRSAGNGGELRLSQLLKLAGLAKSSREAGRSVVQGSVKVNGAVVPRDEARPVPDWWGATLQVGRRSWAKIVEPT